MRHKLVAPLILLTIWIASSWTLLRPSFFKIHDYVHAARVVELLTAVNDGHVPARWSPNFGYGYGMPLFEFYGPLPYYVGAALYWLGLDIVLVLKLLFAGCSLLTAIGAYLLGRKLYGTWAGLVTAAAITLAPYRAVNLFVRGALGEAWGIMAIPWILWAVIKVVRGEKYSRLALALSVTTLCLSHNLTTLMFIPVSLLVAGVLLAIELKTSPDSVKLRTSRVVNLISGFGLGGVLAAFYLIPAFLEKDATKVKTIVGGYFDFHLHFLYLRQLVTPFWGYGGSTWGPDDGFSFFLGWGQLLGLVMTVAVLLVGLHQWLRRHWPQRYLLFKPLDTWLKVWTQGTWQAWVEGLLWLGLVGTSILMTTFKSQLLWDALSPLAFIQFPWRWLSVTLVMVGLCLGWLIGQLVKRSQKIATASVLILVMIVMNTPYFQPEVYLDDADSLYYTDAYKIQHFMSDTLKDYIPAQMPEVLVPPQTLVNVALSQEPANITLNRTQEKLATVTNRTDTDQTYSFNVADFPGWETYLDGQKTPKLVQPTGIIGVTVPPGEHQIGLRLAGTPIRRTADIVSLLGILWLLWWVVTSNQGKVAKNSDLKPAAKP